MILKSRFIVPVDAPVIENGAVHIHDGRVVAVGSAKEITGASVVDFADAVICPGFVNAHTHLELSRLKGCVTPSEDFTDWLRRLVERTIDAAPTKEAVTSAVREGIRQSLSAGVTTLGDITRSPDWTREVLAQSLVRTVSFGEVAAIGTRRHLLRERIDAAVDARLATLRLVVGISPHSPYTLEPEGLRTCVDAATKQRLPICIHLAETPDEERFTLAREGPFVDYLKTIGVWDDNIPTDGLRPVDLVRECGLLGARCIAAHANYVSDDDIERLAKTKTSVVYCPRTHHAFRHPPHRFKDMMAAGVNLCIGTDSLASNPSLSILDELRFLHRLRPEVSPETLMTMGTLNGARALGFGDETGSLSAGKAADLVVIPLDTRMSKPDWTRILETEHEPGAVYVSGVRCRLHP